jgi:hypothetical protein
MIKIVGIIGAAVLAVILLGTFINDVGNDLAASAGGIGQLAEQPTSDTGKKAALNTESGGASEGLALLKGILLSERFDQDVMRETVASLPVEESRKEEITSELRAADGDPQEIEGLLLEAYAEIYAQQ